MMIRKLLLQRQPHRSFVGETVKIIPNYVAMNRMIFVNPYVQQPISTLVSSPPSHLLSEHEQKHHPLHHHQQQTRRDLMTTSRVMLNNTIIDRALQQPSLPPIGLQNQRPRTFVSSSLSFLNSFPGFLQPPLQQRQPPHQVRTFANHRHQRTLKYTKGYRGRSKNCFSIAIRRLQKAWQYGYRDRKTKKRIWRTLWIQRIQAGVRQYSIRYSRFIRSLQYSNIQLNRKVLSDLAATEPFTFKAIIDVTRFQQQQYDNNLEQQLRMKLTTEGGGKEDETEDAIEEIVASEKVA